MSNPSDMPPAGQIEAVAEPYLMVALITPTDYTGTLMELCQSRRGDLDRMEYLSPERVELRYRLPLAEVVIDFFDQLKSRTQGYASLDYEPDGYDESDLVKVDVLLQGVPVDAFLHRRAPRQGLHLRPGHGGPAAGADSPASSSRCPSRPPSAAAYRPRDRQGVRKDVTAKLYGGDVTRKRKLLEKRSRARSAMKSIGRVDIPQEAFIFGAHAGRVASAPCSTTARPPSSTPSCRSTSGPPSRSARPGWRARPESTRRRPRSAARWPVLADQQYLAQPHTSAGRVPTVKGYRFFVDQWRRRSPAPTLDAVDAGR